MNYFLLFYNVFVFWCLFIRISGNRACIQGSSWIITNQSGRREWNWEFKVTLIAIFLRSTKCIQKSMFALLKSRWLLAQNGLDRYVNTRIMTAAVDPKPEKLRQDVILKFRNLKVTVRTLNVHFSPFLLGWLKSTEIQSIFRSMKERSSACFGMA